LQPSHTTPVKYFIAKKVNLQLKPQLNNSMFSKGSRYFGFFLFSVFDNWFCIGKGMVSSKKTGVFLHFIHFLFGNEFLWPKNSEKVTKYGPSFFLLIGRRVLKQFVLRNVTSF
jgi:hypothetical protein